MRLSILAALPLAAALALAPARSEAQVSATVHVGTPNRAWGREVVVRPYAQETYGDWHTSYRHWQPTTLYFRDGHYYPRKVPASRAVVVYRSHNSYFFPPRDEQWNNKDRRYNYRHRPTDDDYNRAPH